MLGNHGRGLARAIFTSPAKLLAKAGVTPNMVTVAGTVINMGLAIGLLARGYLALGGILIGITAFADSLDGVLARLTKQTSEFGAFLDSSLDRLADGAGSRRICRGGRQSGDRGAHGSPGSRPCRGRYH